MLLCMPSKYVCEHVWTLKLNFNISSPQKMGSNGNVCPVLTRIGRCWYLQWFKKGHKHDLPSGNLTKLLNMAHL